MKDKLKNALTIVGSLGVIGGLFAAPLLIERADPNNNQTVQQTAPMAGEDSLYFDNCTEARDAGYENIAEGDPGYRPELDRDGDGYACEPYTP